MTESSGAIYKRHTEFVVYFVEKYGKTSSLIRDDLVSPSELNYALAEYYSIGVMLNSQYQNAKANQFDTDIEFQEWYDKKFEEAKNLVLSDYENTKIKPSLKEFEVRVRTHNAQDYGKWIRKVKNAQIRVRFILRHLDLYKKFDNILMTLSHNMRSEMKALNIENRASSDASIVQNSKIRTEAPEGKRVRHGARN